MILLIQPVRTVGRKLIHASHSAGKDLILLGRTALWLRSAWTKRHDILVQAYVAAIESLAVTVVVASFMGMILALQAGLGLARFGQQDLIAALVSVAMAREMAPFITALILAANVGSSMAAEIGTMAVSEEVEALEVMSIDPVRFLVMPRVVALTIATPMLTVVSNLVGNVGAAIVAFFQIGVTFQAYYQNAIEFIDLKDIYTGLFKAMVFGCVIATVGCGQGLRATGGAIGVGQATRTSVIVSFLQIIILGYFLTSLFYGSDIQGGG